MRKIYSVMLTAFALLVSANLWAIKDATWLQNQFNAGGNITLNDDVTLANAVNIYSGQTVTLNLNGHAITGAFNGSLIMLYHGNLDITGSGRIENSGASNGKGQCIQVEGHSDYTKTNWSVLTIGKDVKVIASGSNGKAVVVDGTVNGAYYTYITRDGSLTGPAFDYDAAKYENIAAYTTSAHTAHKVTTAATMAATLGYVNKYPSYGVVKSNNGVESKLDGYTSDGVRHNVTGFWYGVTTYRSLAYGVKITINGEVYGTTYGYKTNGYVGLDAAEHTENIAQIIVNSTAEIGAGTGKESAGIASNGPADITIDGAKIYGATGVYVKGGTVDINDAVIYSTYEGTYTVPAGKNSGVDAGGSGIVIETNSSYAGHADVTISGDTKVSGTSGYGIEEVVTKATNSNTESLKIEGGTIEAGDQGAIIVDVTTTANENTIQIVGGNVNNEIYVADGENKNAAEVDEFLPVGEEEHYTTTTVTDTETGKTTIVVTYFENTGDKPAEKTSVIAKDGEGNYTNEGKGVEWKVTEDAVETIDQDLTLTYLEAIDATHKQTLNVGDDTHNVTLTVGRIVLGTKAQIVVAAGSRLIVDGEQGIVAPKVENIILTASEDGTSQFLFNPAVTSNRHPNATVEFITKSMNDGNGIYVFQRFGVPTFGQIEEIETSVRTLIYTYNWDSKKWVYDNSKSWINDPTHGTTLDYSQLATPFETYQMMTYAPAAGTVYKMKGEMVGNVNADMAVVKNAWHAFSNSYTGDIDIENLVEDGNYPTVYVYRRNGLGYTWDGVSLVDFEDEDLAPAATKIQPMQGFFVKSTDFRNNNFAIDYDGMLWTPAVGGASAPRRVAADLNRTLAQIRVMSNNENVDNLTLIGSDRYTSDFEDGYDAEKLMNDGFNIYVTADEKLCKLATDNLEGSYLGVSTAQAGTYTLTFTNIKGEQLVLVDLLNGSKTVMTEGASYQFYLADSESNDYRFQIVGRASMPTDVEEVEAQVKGNGIYTLTGQYMGNMSVWNTLPAGVYVVDGVKRVK